MSASSVQTGISEDDRQTADDREVNFRRGEIDQQLSEPVALGTKKKRLRGNVRRGRIG